MPTRRTVRRFGATAALVGLAAALTACDDPPTTVSTTVEHDCEIKSNHIFVPNTVGENITTYATTSPQAVAPDGTATVKIVPEPFSFSGEPTAYGTVTRLSNLVWKVAVPANASLTSHTIDGWANVGAGTPTSSVNGGIVTISVPGPIAASTAAAPNTATLPTLTLELAATGATGSRVETKMAGTSYASPGLTFDTRVTGTVVGTINPSFSCFPVVNPALHSTLISTDVKAPKIKITSPVADQTVTRNSTVPAAFTCDDGNGVGVATCVGTVADGAAIDTSTLGTKTFTVTASDLEGKVSTKSVTYTVVN